jgi:hypothetical protein
MQRHLHVILAVVIFSPAAPCGASFRRGPPPTVPELFRGAHAIGIGALVRRDDRFAALKIDRVLGVKYPIRTMKRGDTYEIPHDMGTLFHDVRIGERMIWLLERDGGGYAFVHPAEEETILQLMDEEGGWERPFSLSGPPYWLFPALLVLGTVACALRRASRRARRTALT